jgi:hypothetical protein
MKPSAATAGSGRPGSGSTARARCTEEMFSGSNNYIAGSSSRGEGLPPLLLSSFAGSLKASTESARVDGSFFGQESAGEAHLRTLLSQSASDSKLSVYSQSRPMADISVDEKILKFVQHCRNYQVRIQVARIEFTLLLRFIVVYALGA